MRLRCRTRVSQLIGPENAVVARMDSGMMQNLLPTQGTVQEGVVEETANSRVAVECRTRRKLLYYRSLT
jgi:hypothetical protein